MTDKLTMTDNVTFKPHELAATVEAIPSEKLRAWARASWAPNCA